MFKNKEFTPIVIVWLGLVVSNFFYLLIGFLSFRQADFNKAAIDTDMYLIMLKVFLGISIILIGGAIYIRKSMHKNKGENPRAKYFTTIILSSAFAEASSVLGEVLFFLGHNIKILLIFVLVAVSVMIYNRPILKEFEEFTNETSQN